MATNGCWRWGLLAILTTLGTAGMAAAEAPSPALFTGLLVATALALLGWAPQGVPRSATTAAQAVLGVVIGVLARPESLADVAADWAPILLTSVATLVASATGGLLLGLRRGISPLTGMLALTAGGAAGLTAISRELGGDDRVVAVVQYLRVGVVTATLPMVAALVYGASGTGAVAAPEVDGAPWFVDLAFVAVCAITGSVAAQRLHMPAGSLLGPMIVALVLDLSGLSFGAQPPELLAGLAYAVIGWQAGVRFTRESLRAVLGALPAAIALIIAVMVVSAGFGLLLSALTGVSLLDGYLATNPGGIYAVLATAVSVGADVTFVVAVQVLRVILMLLVTPMLARLARRWG